MSSSFYNLDGASATPVDTAAAYATAAAASAAAAAASEAAAAAEVGLACLKANNLSDLSSAPTARTNLGLAAVAASGSAADLSTGTLPLARLSGITNTELAAGAAVANIGYTPANKAGDAFTGGINFGSAIGASADDLTSHISLHSAGYGFGITSSRLNYVVAAGGGHYWRINGGDMMSLVGTTLSTAAVTFHINGAGNCGFELGRTDASSTPFIDFHSYSSANDYDFRLICSGGGAGAGGGVLAGLGFVWNTQVTYQNFGATTGSAGYGFKNDSGTMLVKHNGQNWGRIKETLSANRTYYVATTGSDSNTGLTVGDPFLTIQKAVDIIYQTIDMAGYTVTIQLANGTYTLSDRILISGATSGQIQIIGDTVTPSNVVISRVGGAMIKLMYGANVLVSGVTMGGSGGGVNFSVGYGGSNLEVDKVDFAKGGVPFELWAACSLILLDCTISSDVNVFLDCYQGSTFESWGTITFSGTRTIGTTFLRMEMAAGVLNSTFSGSFTGTRHTMSLNSALQTYGAAEATYIPGSVAGTRTTGAQWA